VLPEIDQPAAEGTSAEAPSTPAVGQADLDTWRQEIVAEINKANDERFGGFQKLLAKRDKAITDLSTGLNELKSRTLSDDEREELTDKALQDQLAAAQAENEILRLSREYPAEVVSDFEALLGADSAKDQLELLKKLRLGESKETPAQNPAPETPKGIGSPAVQPASSEVDPNNPPADQVDGLDFEQAFEKDPSLLDKILKGGKLR